MGATLKYVSQTAMDDYYRDYKGNTGFFNLYDFGIRAAMSVADFYQKIWEQRYAELRADKQNKDELVGIDQSLLSEQEITVKDNIGELTEPVMSFGFDKSNTGFQFLLPIQPSDVKFERTSLDEAWQFDYLPESGRIFWYPVKNALRFVKNSACTVNKVSLLYIPATMDKDGQPLWESQIADGLVNMTVASTVAMIKQLSDDKVIKMGLDNNGNLVLQKEMNPE